MARTQVHLSIDGPVATISFRTPEGLNVLSSAVLNDLQDAVNKVHISHQVRFTVIEGEGKVFVAGADIKEMSRFTPADAKQYGTLGQRAFDSIAALPSVTLAALNGAAFGGGLEVALACDFRIAVKSAKLGLPEVTLGLIPGWGGIGRLTRLIGPARARKFFLSGNPVSAEEGVALGLIDEVVNSAEDLRPRVIAFAKGLVRAAPAAVSLAKRAARDGDDLAAFASCFETTDSQEGMAAFLEKRPAKWMEQEL